MIKSILENPNSLTELDLSENIPRGSTKAQPDELYKAIQSLMSENSRIKKLNLAHLSLGKEIGPCFVALERNSFVSGTKQNKTKQRENQKRYKSKKRNNQKIYKSKKIIYFNSSKPHKIHSFLHFVFFSFFLAAYLAILARFDWQPLPRVFISFSIRLEAQSASSSSLFR